MENRRVSAHSSLMKTRAVHTDDVDLTAIRPVGPNGPVSRPHAATMGHGPEVRNEQTAVVLLVGCDTNTADRTVSLEVQFGVHDDRTYELRGWFGCS